MSTEFERQLSKELGEGAGTLSPAGQSTNFTQLELRADRQRRRSRTRFQLVGAASMLALLVLVVVAVGVRTNSDAPSEISVTDPPAESLPGPDSTMPPPEKDDQPSPPAVPTRSQRADRYSDLVRELALAEPALVLSSDASSSEPMERSTNGLVWLSANVGGPGSLLRTAYGQIEKVGSPVGDLPFSERLDPGLLPKGCEGALKVRQQEVALLVYCAEPLAGVSLSILGSSDPAPVDALVELAKELLSANPVDEITGD